MLNTLSWASATVRVHRTKSRSGEQEAMAAEAVEDEHVRKISLVTGLIFNIRIHVFIILARMEVVITYTRLHGTKE